MKLIKARIQSYRSVHDSSAFDVEPSKTLLVGVNEAGKTGILRALQTINPPDGVDPLEALKDYPRSRYSEIQSGKVDPSDVNVAEAVFSLDAHDKAALADLHPSLAAATGYAYYRYMDNSRRFRIDGVVFQVRYRELDKDLARLRAHLTKRDGGEEVLAALPAAVGTAKENSLVQGDLAKRLDAWLETAYPLIDEDDEKEEERFTRLRGFGPGARGASRGVPAAGEAAAAVRLLLDLLYCPSPHPAVGPRGARGGGRPGRGVRLWQPVPAQAPRLHREGTVRPRDRRPAGDQAPSRDRGGAPGGGPGAPEEARREAVHPQRR
jgi:hypothetical protein